MRFDVLTLFPELFEPSLRLGVTRRAFESRQVDVQLWGLRDFADNAYRRVDDRPFGGGPGMVMLIDPLERALAAVHAARAAADIAAASPSTTPQPPVILFSPAGRPLTQARVQAFSRSPEGAILICGRYEGLDQRFVDRHVTEEISLGDFVLSGGELPALTLLDAVARLMPGVLNDEKSHQQDSFSDGLLDCPHYSRPEVHAGEGVPSVLMSGHHAEIARWRREQQLTATARRRPDLLEKARREGLLSRQDLKLLSKLGL
ncbi:tRNA (guanine-N1)-methyltransferase [Leptothrix ochracea L12]|uniref:tRNA (guanine-N(1)-)-methyltransferase n=1 Tax=Leptothrix ochracea L12 TaxID=735332 RepID=I4Z554_9BURK|nr:tRNA (guanosine(37)-N1)-methyltransferase TrmD [Leptothrix ochracea]EIM31346.1 tRNA (guanine-N1)-methyltransferase [Leptothrix ochracea L12]